MTSSTQNVHAKPVPCLSSLALPGGDIVGGAQPVIKGNVNRTAVIVVAVIVLHAGFIWALQSGLLMRAAELVVPVELLAQFVEPTSPKVEPPAPAVAKPQKVAAPVKKAVTKPVIQPAPAPLAVPDPTPAPNAPAGVTMPQPGLSPMTPPVTASPGVAASPATPALSAAVQLPSSDADYLQNPRPPYPSISRRLNEQGKTTVRVLIGIDGTPQRTEIVQSSGFERLDQAAVATVMRWRYMPGKRGGVAEAMWFNVPINWVLQ